MQSALRDFGSHGELNYSRTGTFFRQDQSLPFGEFTRKGFTRTDGSANRPLSSKRWSAPSVSQGKGFTDAHGCDRLLHFEG
jgi:hypothetical protein